MFGISFRPLSRTCSKTEVGLFFGFQGFQLSIDEGGNLQQKENQA